jgi:hypothetical protein
VSTITVTRDELLSRLDDAGSGRSRACHALSISPTDTSKRSLNGAVYSMLPATMGASEHLLDIPTAFGQQHSDVRKAWASLLESARFYRS